MPPMPPVVKYLLLINVGLFFLEAFFLYTYYYGWHKFSPRVHLALGLGLNLVGTAIMLIAGGLGAPQRVRGAHQN